ncbi:MAG: C1 family peptidase [Acetobacteraceae bacterium]|nr:C1 family peptidase [Acetobacteraceae bacterium]
MLRDLRPLFGPARDQNPRPTCLAFAASDGHAAARGLPFEPLSAEWAYYHAVRRDGGRPDSGATLGGMLNGIRFDGQPIEAAWPYTNGPDPDPATWAPPPGVIELFRRNSTVQAACAVGNVVATLGIGLPVLLVMTISDAFYLPDPDGVVAAAEPPDPERVHAVLAVGHGRFDGGAEAVLVRNSWGPAWGAEGCAWLHADYLAPRLLRSAVMTGEVA